MNEIENVRQYTGSDKINEKARRIKWGQIVFVIKNGLVQCVKEEVVYRTDKDALVN